MTKIDSTAVRPPASAYAGPAGLVALALLLLFWGVAEPSLWPYLIGAAVAALAFALFAYRLTARVGRRALRALLAAGVAVVVAVAIAAVPAVGRYVTTDGSVRWSTDVPTRWEELVPLNGRIYLYETLRGFRVLDRSTGRELFSVGGIRVTGDLAGDGSMVLSSRSSGEYYAADGRRLWRLEGTSWRRALGMHDRTTAPKVMAVADGVAVFRTCGRKDCRYAGIDRTGSVAWQRVGTETWFEDQVPFPGADKAGPVPEVVVDVAGGEYVTLAAADGRVLGRRPASAGPGSLPTERGAVGLVGDLAIFTGRTDEGCTVVGERNGREAWHATGLPCNERGGVLTPSLLTETRMYAEAPDGRSVTVDLRNGRWRKLAEVAFSATAHGQHKIGVPGENVVVYRDGPDLTAVDAGSGRRLWTFKAPGDATPGVDVGRDAVVLLTRPGGHNPLIPREVREDGYLVIVLDARTGRTVGRLVPFDGVATSAPLGAGQALVVTTDRPTAMLVGRR
ncbi:MAG TPA: PQQ-binding-like beta-propeller repeat protein [Streptosporangiales bacterium]